MNIETRAYFNWINAGKPEGQSLNFWLDAEKNSHVDIKWSKNTKPGQIYNNGIELALCSDDNEQISTFVFCKDFFQDAILSYIHKQNCAIYGYEYNPEKMPKIPQKNTKILIANAEDKNFSSKIQNIENLLHQFESYLNLEKTYIQKCNNPPEKYASGVFLLIGDKKIMNAPPVLSLWTLLARNGVVHNKNNNFMDTIQKIIDEKIKPAQKNDHIYLKWAKPGIEIILQKGIDALFGTDINKNYPKEQTGRSMHHYSGIVAYGSCKSKEYFPDWIYPEESKETPPNICFA